MGYEFDPNRYEGDEDSSTTEPVPNSASKEASAANDNKKTNKDVDSSRGISELKVWERSFSESKISRLIRVVLTVWFIPDVFLYTL